MSQGSCSSHVKCNCGTIAKHLTSSTPSNPGRKFYKCPRPKGNSCGFWEWEDELFPEIQWNNVQNLTSSLDAIKIERDKLQEELIAIEARHLIEVNKMKEELIGLKSKQQFDLKKVLNLEEKLANTRMLLLISWGIFISFLAASLIN
ncbi:uncharacterized protein LOC132066405 [Lycium ferocissimum]|uniref:uncharacterized protein LOC132066405 n=1 Tax=Lycium ferocissimum TaxID=112874 RepID=UPI002814DB51|nr:uncharacterized protein LOC132066405 [Lycium ferocissimum]